jgi:hypothetical protein
MVRGDLFSAAKLMGHNWASRAMEPTRARPCLCEHFFLREL